MIARTLLVIASLCGLFLSPTYVHAAELIVDNDGPFVQVTGPWTSSALTSGFSGADYLARPGGSGDATVFWPFPATASPGKYEVFARWTSGQDRATNAPYWISATDGTITTNVNQQINGGSWQSLGSFSFQPAKGQGVTLSDHADGVVIADAIRWVGPADAPAAPPSASSTQASTSTAATPSAAGARAASQTSAAAPADGDTTAAAVDTGGIWTVAMTPADLHAGPDPQTDLLAKIPQFSYLQILGYSGDWAYVYNPRAHGTAYVTSALLGPSDPPPAWVTAPPPTPAATVERMGRVVGTAPLSYYPVDDKYARVGTNLYHNQSILVHDRIQAADGSTWYRVDAGYLPSASVRLPRAPAQAHSGRWIDADLSEPAMLTAYDGSTQVLTTLAIKGTIANQTPTGTFSIQRRVADETMDSGTLGIPANGPGGYHLEHVLYTQYFTNDGASIHFNYWSSNFGYSGSHGCLGLTREDSLFLWNWADIGTVVVIHT